MPVLQSQFHSTSHISLPRIGRTLPPVAVALGVRDLLRGLFAIFQGEGAVDRFESELREYFRVSHCCAVSSGKTAMVLILRALHDLQPGRDEVLIPAYTCYSVPSAIVRAGFKVRLCDLAPGTFDFDHDHLQRLMNNERLLAVVPTHLYGVPADVNKVRDMARQSGVFVIEDAAQAMGNEWNGTKLGTSGDVGLFSLGRGKCFSTVEGGVILTDNEPIGRAIARQMAETQAYDAAGCLKLALYAVALMVLTNPWFYWLPRSLPFLKIGRTEFDTGFSLARLSWLQAGLASGWQSRIAGLKQMRRRKIQDFIEEDIPLISSSTAEVPDLLRYPVLAKDAETKAMIVSRSDELGLGISGGYPESIDRIPELADQFDGECSYPVATETAARVVSLPLHSHVSTRDTTLISHLIHGRTVTDPMSTEDLLKILLLIILWCAAFAPLFPELVRDWIANSDNSHAFLVPFISLFLVWQQRELLHETPTVSSPFGGALLAASLLTYVVSSAGGLAFPARLAMVASLSGLAWFCLGGKKVRLLAFPLGILLFMVPIPYSLLSLVSGRLQLMATHISEKLISQCAIPVYREGNMLYFVQTQLEVAEACSGIRSIVSLTMISLVFCFMSRKGWWRKISLILAAIPIAIAANIVRVTGTGVLAHYFGDKVAKGFLHEFSGIVIFIFGFALLFSLFHFLNKGEANDLP
ncbi:exosortase A [Pelotalea chapellei]|nr:exosortase A [Pelotalea chapellei]